MSDLTREWSLINSVLQGGKQAFRLIEKHGIISEHLGDAGSEEYIVWELFRKSRYLSTLPDASAIFHATGITVPTTTDPCDPKFYAEIVRNWALYNALYDKLEPVVRNLDDDPLSKRDELAKIIQETAWVRSGFIDRTNNPDSIREVREAYERAEKLRMSGKLLGFSSPWESWDKRSLGLQDGKFVVILGKREQGKSLFTFVWLEHMWAKDLQPNEKILYVSMEMDALTVKQRTFAIRSKIDYGAFRRGDLNTTQRKRFFDWCEEQETKPDPTKPEVIFVYSDTVRNVADIAALVIEHNCKAVFIDGLYILGDDGKTAAWEQVAKSAKQAKILLANGLNVPVVVTSQFSGSTGRNNMRADADNAGYAKAMSDYADIVLGIYADEEMRHKNERVIQCLKGREFKPIHWRMKFDLQAMDFRELDSTDDIGTWFPEDGGASGGSKTKGGGGGSGGSGASGKGYKGSGGAPSTPTYAKPSKTGGKKSIRRSVFRLGGGELS